LPRAIQFGMTPYQFWHEEIDLIEAYEKAYYNDMAQKAHLIGQNSFNAFSLAYGNFWSKDKNLKDFAKEFKMPDMIKDFNDKLYIKTQKQKDTALGEKYQKSNNAWI